MPTSENEISDFLFYFKFITDTPGNFVLVDRDKNLQALAEIGISVDQALNDVILKLTYENYSSGPEEDYDRSGMQVWIFGYDYDGMELYIKLNYSLEGNLAKCISIHEAQHPLTYPYKENGE